jgi:tetratricopeptide (TPR) repeat protein
MGRKPIVEKLGHVPKAEFLLVVSADQKQLVGEALIFDVLTYFGSLVEHNKTKVEIPPDYQAMSRMLHASVKLDPYNMDAYYFAQSILVWDVKQVQLANALLDYGMKYRTWDWYLPFFAGFNSGYFLKDYPGAARYYMRAGELSGNDLFMNLAGRYLNEAGQSELAIGYLDTMVKGAKNAAIRQTLATRLEAIKAARSIELARDAFLKKSGRLPASVPELVQAGLLPGIPRDPYGGSFYLDPDGKVRTTSNYARPGKK